MADAKLKFGDSEIVLGHGVTTLGRTTENQVSFPSDANVSRYHAEIEWRDGDFYLIDLRSSNGTTLNGAAVTGEKRLNDGDEILLGGSSKAKFSIDEKKSEDASNVAARENSSTESANEEIEKKEEAEIAQDTQAVSKTKMPMMLGIAGATCGLAVVCLVGAVIYSMTGTACAAKAVIVKPENGETIIEETEIEVEAQNAECAVRAIFLINGEEFANSTEQPFTAKLDPNRFPTLANGSLQKLQIVLEDEKGNKLIQPEGIDLAFETIEISTPTPTPEEEIAGNPTPTPGKSGGKVSVGEVQEMSKNLIKEFSGNLNYKFDTQFLQEVQKKTGEFTEDGYYARAAAYKDIIRVAFVQERGLDAPLGFILAMSRSKFKPQKTGADEGLWQMSQAFAADNGYSGLCGTETLADASQNCAAKAASLYLKSLIVEAFEGDVIYTVAAFGKSPQEANIWKVTLPADKTDFWKIIKDPKQREQVVRFFAAGIVAENPQKFNLKKDQPISDLYKTLVAN